VQKYEHIWRHEEEVELLRRTEAEEELRRVNREIVNI
jgi:hypothetical protein